MSRRPVFKLIKNWFLPDIQTRVAKTQKRLSELEKLLPPSKTPYSQRAVLNSFFNHVADTLSFGVVPSEGLFLDVPHTKSLCFIDFTDTPNPFGLLAETVEPLMYWRLNPRCKGEKVIALNVAWINVPHRLNNPFQEIGFFCARAYSKGSLSANSSSEWKEVKQSKNLKS
jgi:hypothetical protein